MSPYFQRGGCYWGGTLRLPWKQGVLVEASFVEDRPWKLLQGHHTLQAAAIHVMQKPRTCMFFQIPGMYLNNFHPKHLMDSHPISFWCWKNLLPTNWSVSCTVVLLHLLLHQFIDDSRRNFRFHCMMRSVKDLDGIAQPLKRSKMEVLWPRKLLGCHFETAKLLIFGVVYCWGIIVFDKNSIIERSTGEYMIAWEDHGIWWILD